MTTPHSIRQSKAVQRHTGLTFHLATRLLPERVRHPTYVLYAFFRTADEVVDAADPGPPATRRRELERLRAAALGERETDDPVLEAVADLYARHDIAREDVDAFVDAMLMNVETDRYRTHEQLDTYLRGSSVAVGHMMLDVMDPDEAARARPHAAALGEAFQLTNFLRDVREDVREYDRIYLPAATLRAHGSSHADVASLTPSDDVRAAIREELRRTERLPPWRRRHPVSPGGLPAPGPGGRGDVRRPAPPHPGARVRRALRPTDVDAATAALPRRAGVGPMAVHDRPSQGVLPGDRHRPAGGRRRRRHDRHGATP
jgi:phytoene/squalene synthetase